MLSTFSFFSQKDGKIIANSKLQVIISKELFDDGIATFVDTAVHTLGFFIFKVYSSADGSKFKLYQCNLPIVVSLNAFSISNDSDNYYIEFEKDDIILNSTSYVKRVNAVNDFLKFMISAKLNVTKPDELIKLFQQNAAMNDTRIASQPSIVEALAAELVRWDKDETKPLRLALKDKGVSIKDFKLVNIKEISRVTSVFNAISFEDINKSIQSAVIMSRNNKEQITSPVEKILHY